MFLCSYVPMFWLPLRVFRLIALFQGELPIIRNRPDVNKSNRNLTVITLSGLAALGTLLAVSVSYHSLINKNIFWRIFRAWCLFCSVTPFYS